MAAPRVSCHAASRLHESRLVPDIASKDTLWRARILLCNEGAARIYKKILLKHSHTPSSPLFICFAHTMMMTMFDDFAILVILLLCCAVYFKKRRQRLPPGPPDGIFGFTRAQVSENEPWKKFAAWSKEYGTELFATENL